MLKTSLLPCWYAVGIQIQTTPLQQLKVHACVRVDITKRYFELFPGFVGRQKYPVKVHMEHSGGTAVAGVEIHFLKSRFN